MITQNDRENYEQNLANQEQILSDILKDKRSCQSINKVQSDHQNFHHNIQQGLQAVEINNQLIEQSEGKMSSRNDLINQFSKSPEINEIEILIKPNVDHSIAQIIKDNQQEQLNTNISEAKQFKSESAHQIHQQMERPSITNETSQLQKQIKQTEEIKIVQQHPSKKQEGSTQLGREENRVDQEQNKFKKQQSQTLLLNPLVPKISIPKNIQSQQIKIISEDADPLKLKNTKQPQQAEIILREPRQISIPENNTSQLDHIHLQWSKKIQKQELLLSRYTSFASLKMPKASLFPPFVRTMSDAKIQLSPPPPQGDKKPKFWERLGLKKATSIDNSKVCLPVAPISTINSQIINPIIPQIPIAKNMSQQNTKQAIQGMQPLSIAKKQRQQIKIISHQQNIQKQQKQKTQLKLPSSQLPLTSQSTKLIQKSFSSKPENQQLKHNPLLNYQRFIDNKNQDKRQEIKQEDNEALPQPEKPPQQIPRQPEFSAESIQILQARPLSKKSSDESGVIIYDSSFQKDSLQKIKQKSKQIEQLQIKLKQQEQLNRELENESSIVLKLVISAAAAFTAGGIFLIARKNKAGALVVGLAASVATFLLKK